MRLKYPLLYICLRTLCIPLPGQIISLYVTMDVSQENTPYQNLVYSNIIDLLSKPGMVCTDISHHYSFNTNTTQFLLTQNLIFAKNHYKCVKILPFQPPHNPGQVDHSEA